MVWRTAFTLFCPRGSAATWTSTFDFAGGLLSDSHLYFFPVSGEKNPVEPDRNERGSDQFEKLTDPPNEV